MRKDSVMGSVPAGAPRRSNRGKRRVGILIADVIALSRRVKNAVLLAFLAAVLSSAGNAAENENNPRRILMLFQDSSILSSSIEIAEGLRKGLGNLPATKVEVYTEFLDSGRFSAPDMIQQMADVMVAKYRAIPLQVVVTAGPEALRFMLDHGDRIAPGASVVFGDISERTLSRLSPPEHMTGVVTAYDVRDTIDLALGLQPDARRIVVVSGSAEFDRYWRESAHEKLHDTYRGIPVEYLSDLTLDGFVAHTRELPPKTILLLLTIFEDASGRKYRPRDAAATIAAASGAPSYGLLSSYVGQGIVGGNLATYQSIGENIADATAKVLSGNNAQPRILHATTGPVLDWRQLQRWGLDTSGLRDSGVNLVYYSPTIWEEYRWQIVFLAIALLAQTAAIAGLLYERRGRLAAEMKSRRSFLQLVHLNQSATAGALSASIAHELSQPLGAIHANAEAAEVMLSGNAPNLDLINQILADIRKDDKRATDIIARMRVLLRKRSEAEWVEFDLNEVVQSAIQILHAEARRRSVVVSASQPARPLQVRADKVHVQQVILNLGINAMDAMIEAESAERKLSLDTRLTEACKAELAISDTGRGIPSDKLTRIFDAFYTTKPTGTGLGLSIARTIVETYGGKLWADNRPEGGAVFRFVLPLSQPVEQRTTADLRDGLLKGKPQV